VWELFTLVILLSIAVSGIIPADDHPIPVAGCNLFASCWNNGCFSNSSLPSFSWNELLKHFNVYNLTQVEQTGDFPGNST